jgi:hypothetical protein
MLKKAFGNDNLENINELLQYFGKGKSLEQLSDKRTTKKYLKKLSDPF